MTRRTPQGSFVLAMVDDQKKLLMQGGYVPACDPCVMTNQFGAVCTQLLHLGVCLSPACSMLREVLFRQDSNCRGQLLCWGPACLLCGGRGWLVLLSRP